MVIEGSVFRNKPIRVLRDDVVIYEGELESLRRFKDEATDVRNGMECGIGVKDYNDVKAGDLIEVYDVTQVKRSL
jgi:translation initiation factor IF-2